MADILISMNKTTDRLWKLADEWEKTPEHFDGVNPFCIAIHAVRQMTNAPELPKSDQRWIRVEDKLPERPDWYQVYAPDYCGGSSRGKELHKGVMFAKWNGKSWGIEKGYYNRPNIVVAWREIPKPPEGVKQNG